MATSIPMPACAGSFCVHGFPFHLRTNNLDVKHLIAGLYRNFQSTSLEGPAQEAALEVDCDRSFSWRIGERAGTNPTLSSALWNLEASLCETIIRSQQRSIAIHAAAIQVENSVALLAGCSQAGKTTLSLGLARRGLPVAGDDVALVEPDTQKILPIPRCFHLDDRSVALLDADGLQMPPEWVRFRFIVPNDFGVPANPASPARWLIFMQGPRAEHPIIAPVSQAEMTARLLSETGQGPLTDSETIAVICQVAAGASCFMLTPGAFGETADAVAALLTKSKRHIG